MRDLAAATATSDTARALVIARGINEPWFGCQALAWVARYAPEDEFDKIIQESLSIGSAAEDPYKVVGAAAWSVRALVERGRLDRSAVIVPELLNRSRGIELYASRSEALFLLFHAVFPAGRQHWLPVFEALREASFPMINWRQKRNLRDAILIVWNDDREMAEDLTRQIADGRLRRQIEGRIAARKRRLPRPFFWRSDCSPVESP